MNIFKIFIICYSLFSSTVFAGQNNCLNALMRIQGQWEAKNVDPKLFKEVESIFKEVVGDELSLLKDDRYNLEQAYRIITNISWRKGNDAGGEYIPGPRGGILISRDNIGSIQGMLVLIHEFRHAADDITSGFKLRAAGQLANEYNSYQEEAIFYHKIIERVGPRKMAQIIVQEGRLNKKYTEVLANIFKFGQDNKLFSYDENFNVDSVNFPTDHKEALLEILDYLKKENRGTWQFLEKLFIALGNDTDTYSKASLKGIGLYNSPSELSSQNLEGLVALATLFGLVAFVIIGSD